MLTRRRFKQTRTLQERLADAAERLRAQARNLPPGPERETLLQRALQAETASRIEAWLESPGLRPPS
ncbi:hypothetical protein [Enterobacter cloacae]|jgi:hypothetical protein|uniref:hypothetical protein n=1 Tax=Enterobacter cloacae TaxID=550 RepID=UPI0013D1AA84|nr:hypothetical protein [Enterobacter cloacae]